MEPSIESKRDLAFEEASDKFRVFCLIVHARSWYLQRAVSFLVLLSECRQGLVKWGDVGLTSAFFFCCCHVE